MDTSKTTFGDRLAKLIEQDKRTQSQIARDADLSGATIKRWKDREEAPPLKRTDTRNNLKAIVQTLGTTKEWLLEGEGKMHNRDVDIEERSLLQNGENGNSHPNVATLPMSDAESRTDVVVDARDLNQLYSPDELRRVRRQVIKASSMQGVVSKNMQVEYTEGGYRGPDMYLIKLTEEDRPFPAYVRRLSPKRYEIEFTNREEPIHLTKRGDDWINEYDEQVPFEIVGPCERWESRTVNMP